MAFVANCVSGIAAIVGLVATIAVLVIAFRKSIGWGFACLLIPFAILVFIIKHSDEVGGWGGAVVLSWVVQIVVVVVSFIAVANMSDVELAQYALDNAGPRQQQIASELRRKGYIVENGKVRTPNDNVSNRKPYSPANANAPRTGARNNRPSKPSNTTGFNNGNRPNKPQPAVVDEEAQRRQQEREEQRRLEQERRKAEQERRKAEQETRMAEQRRLQEEARAKAKAEAEAEAAELQAKIDAYEAIPDGLVIGPAPTDNPETWTTDESQLDDLNPAVQIGPYSIRPPKAMLRNIVNEKNALFGRADASIKIYLKPRKAEDGEWPVLLVDTEGKGSIGERNYANAMKRKYEIGYLNNMNFARIGDPPGTRGRSTFTYVTVDSDHFVEIQVEYRHTNKAIFPALLASVHTFQRADGNPQE